jgi:hypothetical protein
MMNLLQGHGWIGSGAAVSGTNLNVALSRVAFADGLRSQLGVYVLPRKILPSYRTTFSIRGLSVGFRLQAFALTPQGRTLVRRQSW